MSDKKPAKTRKTAAPGEVKSRGGQSTFSQSIADEIIERLSKGEPLEKICRDEHMPSSRTVLRWKEADAAFMSDIAHAREAGFDQIAVECLDIADFGLNDTYEDDDGNKRTDTDVIQRSKLRIETRLKLLAKWDPKRYGDKVDINHGGQDGNPIKTESTVTLSAEEAYKRLIDGSA